MEYIKNIFKGIVLGVSNIIPGVSAGTMAVVMGIYDKLIKSISTLFRNFRGSFKFLFFIGVGVVIGIVFFSRLISYFLTTYPWQMNYLFMGLIAGTFGLLFKTLKSYKPRRVHYIFFIITFLIIFGMEYLNFVDSNNLHSGNINVILLLISGFLASSAMILPGVSGSFVLVLLGVYNNVITAVSQFNLSVLIPFGFGVLLGFILMVKIIEYLLNRFRVQTYMGIVGLVTGSLIAIFPGFEFSLRGLSCILIFMFGFLISFYICRVNKEES